jgi:hypothetical protein
VNENWPIPSRGNVVLTPAAVLEAGLLTSEAGLALAARVYVYKPDLAESDDRVFLDSTIISADPDHLDRLADAARHAAAMLRDELGAAAVRKAVV